MWRKEVALIARRIRCGMQLGPVRPELALDVMARCHAIGIEILRCLEQILELHPLIAPDAGHRCGPGEIAVGEFVDHRFAKDVLVIEYVMRKAHILGHAARIVNVDPRATCPLLGKGRAMIVELERHADHVITFLGQMRRHHRTVHASRHRYDDAGFAGGLAKPSEFSSASSAIYPILKSSAEYRKMRNTHKARFHVLLNPVRQAGAVSKEGKPMFLKKVDGPRTVTLPDGSTLSRADLPPADTHRLGRQPQGRRRQGGAERAVAAEGGTG